MELFNVYTLLKGTGEGIQWSQVHIQGNDIILKLKCGKIGTMDKRCTLCAVVARVCSI